MLTELEQTICFAAVCDTGSMTAAAKELNRSKAHVSRQVSALEQHIGLKLLHRTTRKLTLTDAGNNFKEEALQLYRNAQLVRQKSLSLNQQLTGKFVITAPVSISTFVLAPIIPELQNTFPDIAFEILSTNDNLNLINEGIDLAIRTGNVVDDKLIAHQIGVDNNVFYASNQFLKTNTPPSEISDLWQFKMLVNHHSMKNNNLALFNGTEIINWKPKNLIKISVYPLLLDLVKQGMGIGFAPNYCLPTLTAKHQISQVIPQWKGQEWPVYLIYPFHVPLPYKLAKISAFLRKKLSKDIFK